MEQASSHISLAEVPIVTLYVGPQKTTYHVHLDLLCNASAVFKAAFSGKFRESKERSMDLPDDDLESVDRAIQWLYNKHYDLSAYDTKDNATKRCWELARLQVFADKWDFPELKKNIVDAVHRHGRAVKNKDEFMPPLPLVLFVYETNPVESSFRRMMVDWYTWSMTLKWFDWPETRSQLVQNPEFTADMTIALGRRIADTDQLYTNPFKAQNSNYYYDCL